jgi:hypothetical protein
MTDWFARSVLHVAGIAMAPDLPRPKSITIVPAFGTSTFAGFKPRCVIPCGARHRAHRRSARPAGLVPPPAAGLDGAPSMYSMTR